MAKVMISMPDALLEEIDRAAKEQHRTRSELVREATRKYLVQPGPSTLAPVRKKSWEEIDREMERIREALSRKRKPGAPSSTAIIRWWRDHGFSLAERRAKRKK